MICKHVFVTVYRSLVAAVAQFAEITCSVKLHGQGTESQLKVCEANYMSFPR